ncbi:hypothetical protein HXX76_000665 [Chlamydomonas incerta]|uniref:Guanylate cyclase domain-containing protein n=1 Tax=Chlamydomonas incerta TaxID=51695 RepID=A0A836B366_CHLIN|nr:hypothetical protein HXX76_000665 [Chlamydomonas incerta]|eukprot:KAG2446063.1 hypothetical protein HXX76_000665 [Chlamydomonas incerta]
MAPLISSVLPLISAGAAFAVSGGSTYSASGLPPAAAAVVAAAAAAAAAASANRTSNNSMLAGTTTTGALGSTAMAATAPLLLNWTIVAGTGAVLDAVMGADLFGPARHHSYVLPATVLGDMVELARWPVDLSALTVDDPDLDWRGILPLYREVLAVYDGKVYALPFNGIMQVMYYRRDVFEAAGLPPPRTWAEVQAAAARFNGTDLDGDGLANDFGVCIWQAADCERFSLPLTMLLASLVQARGRNSGLQMDPETGRMAHNTVAWETALQLLRNLSAFAPPPSAFQTSTSRDCLILTGFGEGKCAMTFTMAGVFKAFSSVANTASKVRGRMGMAPLPGSPVVLDWGRNELVPCNFDRCPYAVSYDQPENVQQYLAQRSEQQKQQQAAVAAAAAAALAAAAAAAARAANGSISQLQAASAQQVPNSSATASSSAGHHRRRQAQQQQQPQGLPALLANRAPFASAGGLSLLLNSKYSTAQQVAAYSIMVAMARSAASFQAIMTTSSSDGPTRMEHLDPANEGRWIAAGFHPNDTAQFLSAMRESIASGNTALDIRSRYARQYMRALTIATVMAANHSIPVPVIVRTSRALFDQTFTPDVMPAVLASYRASIRYINASAAGPAPAIASTDSASGAQRQSMLGVAVGVAVAGVVTLLALGAYSWWWTRRRRRPRDGGGRILAPGVGEGTSLVVTDILESTRLWEELPSAVMDMALQLHHGCIRRVSTATGGYESATEGDSFILAFHTPQAAVLFCLAAQEELARIVWPQELLQDDTCKPLWVRGAPKQQQQQQELSAHAGSPGGRQQQEEPAYGNRPVPVHAHLLLAAAAAGAAAQTVLMT